MDAELKAGPTNLEAVHSSLFLDLTSLVCVRFERLDEGDAAATLLFNTGISEKVGGPAARSLHETLMNSIGKTNLRLSEDSQHEPATVRNLFVTNSLLGRKKAWYYRKDEDSCEYIMAFVNAKGSCSLRTFEAESGIYKGKRYVSGNYQDNFAELIDGAVELTVYNQPNLERDCKERLPDDVLTHLRSQIAAVGGKRS